MRQIVSVQFTVAMSLTNVTGPVSIVHGILASEPLVVTDIGARGGWSRKWSAADVPMMMIGFEADADEAARLATSAQGQHRFITAALSDVESEKALYHTRDPHCTSLYKPDRQVIERLRPGDKWMEVTRTECIVTTTLDQALSAADVSRVDFIKLDTQGSELDILKGSTGTLGRGVLGVEVEVEFIPIYEGQPLFHEVNAFMLDHGFAFMGFQNVRTTRDFCSWRSRATRPWGRLTHAWEKRVQGPAQILYADAFYLRDVEYITQSARRDPAAAERLCVAAHSIAGVTGYVHHANALASAVRHDRLIRQPVIDEMLKRERKLARRHRASSVMRLLSHVTGVQR